MFPGPAAAESAIFPAGAAMLSEGFQGSWLLLALDWLIRLVALCWIPVRTSPGAARSWLLLVGFVPLLGLPLYLLLGHPWLSARRVRRQAQVSRRIRRQQALQHALRWRPEEGTAAAEIAALVERQGDFMPTHGNAVQLLDDYDGALRRRCCPAACAGAAAGAWTCATTARWR